MDKALYVLVLLVGLSSCTSNVVHTSYTALDNGVWPKEEMLEFNFDGLDSIAPHHVFFNVRNDNAYEFSNLFLIVEMEAPLGDTKVDTLEYNMAYPSGAWMGKGIGSLKESKLWYLENVKFKDQGVYTVRIQHAMRKNGEAEGMEALTGITDIGLQIEKAVAQ